MSNQVVKHTPHQGSTTKKKTYPLLFLRSQTGRRGTKAKVKKCCKKNVIFSIRAEITMLHIFIRFDLFRGVNRFFSLFGVFPCPCIIIVVVSPSDDWPVSIIHVEGADGGVCRKEGVGTRGI